MEAVWRDVFDWEGGVDIQWDRDCSEIVVFPGGFGNVDCVWFCDPWCLCDYL